MFEQMMARFKRRFEFRKEDNFNHMEESKYGMINYIEIDTNTNFHL